MVKSLGMALVYCSCLTYFGPRGPWLEPRPGALRCGLEQVTFTPCLVLVKPRKRWTWSDCDEAGDYVVPNVLSPRDLVSRPDNMDETVPYMSHIHTTHPASAATGSMES